ncbi:MAG: hypothetical protein ACR2PY_07110 [Salinispira sp.]
MKKIHKISSCLIFLVTIVFTFLFNAQMTDLTAENLVTFFSVVFGFYMTSIAILYNSSYIKILHNKIDKKAQKRGTYILKDYLLISGYWSIFSIITIILFTTFATKSNTGVFSTNIIPFMLPILNMEINLNLLLSSSLFGIAALNIYYMLLLIHTIIDGLIEEAKR